MSDFIEKIKEFKVDLKCTIFFDNWWVSIVPRKILTIQTFVKFFVEKQRVYNVFVSLYNVFVSDDIYNVK